MSQYKRNSGFDLARAFAVFGMVIVNFKLVMGATTGAAWLQAVASSIEGKAVALFIVLAGMGMMSGYQRVVDDALQVQHFYRKILKRSFLFIALGLVFTLIWPADILHFYGFYFLMGLLLIRKNSVVIWWTILALIMGFVVLVSILDYEKGWDFENLHYLDLWSVEGMLRHLFFNGFHPVIPWASLLLFGIWLARQDLDNTKKRRALLLCASGLFLAVEVLTTLIRHYIVLDDELAFFFDTAPMPPLPLYFLSAAAFSVVIICTCLEVEYRHYRWRLLSLLSKTGQMSLSIYILHVVLGMGLLESMALIGDQSIELAWGCSILFIILSMLLTFFWFSFYRYGPMEWVMKKISG